MVRRKTRTALCYIVDANAPGLDSRTNSDDEAANDPYMYDKAVNLPAHKTKHLGELLYRFPSIGVSFRLVQHDDTNSTGSSLWLSSQVLSSYLLHVYAKPQHRKGGENQLRKVLELGAGTGLLSLLMARLGWQVTATDIPPVLDSVLRPNIQAGLYQLTNQGMARADQIQVCELDWTVSPETLTCHPQLNFPNTPKHVDASSPVSRSTCTQHIDLILTADTIYEPSLVQPLLSTISHLYHGQANTKPTVLLALERRDPAHMTEALRIAHEQFALPFKQISPKRIRKIFDALGDGATWPRTDWDGVEIWKL